MCGIAGTNTLTATTHAILGHLIAGIESMGPQSWGCTDGQNVEKNLGHVTSNWKWPQWITTRPFVVHTRQASTGVVSLPNQHPFEIEGPAGKVVGVHNGCLANHTELNKKYNRDHAVDSQHIFDHLAHNRALKDIEGWGACAYWLNDTLHLMRFNSVRMRVVQLETGEMVFCSTLEPIEWALRALALPAGTVVPVEEKFIYHFSSEGELVKGVQFEIADTDTGASHYSHYCGTGYTRSYSGSWAVGSRKKAIIPLIGTVVRNGNLCAFQNCGNTVNRKSKVVCEECLKVLKEAANGATNGVD